MRGDRALPDDLSVHVRKTQIEHDEVIAPFLLQPRECLFASRRLDHLVAEAVNHLGDQPTQRVLVFDDQDVSNGRPRYRWRRRRHRCGLGVLADGKTNREAGPGAPDVLGEYAASMGLDDADRETETEAGPCARALRGEERVEDSPQVLWRDAGTI